MLIVSVSGCPFGTQMLPAHGLAARLAHHPSAERHDEPRLFGERNERERREHSARGMVPAHERLDAGDLARVQEHDRLIAKNELLALDRVAQIGLELEPLHRFGVHARFVAAVLPLPALLRDVHRHVGVAQQIARRVIRVRDGDADARGREHFLPLEMEGVLHELEHALDHSHGRIVVRRILDEDRELVAAEARDRVGRAHRGLHALRRVDQQHVALRVAERVVDGLEVVEIEEDHGDRARVPAREHERVRHAIEKERAIRQPGERVVKCLMRELGLQRLALADVARVEHDAAHRGLVEQIRSDHLDVAPSAIVVPHAPLRRRRHRALRQHGHEEAQRARHVVGVHEIGEALPFELVRLVSEDLQHGRARVADDGVGVDDRDDVRRMLHERLEACFVLALRLFGEQTHVLAHRGDLADDDDRGDDDAADREHAHGLGPAAHGDDAEQAVADGDAEVRKEGERLRARRRCRAPTRRPAASSNSGPARRRSRRTRQT